LLWSKGQMENFKPSNKIIPVDEIFAYVKGSLNQPDNIQLFFEQQPGMQLNVDEHYLKTIIYNLTNNAIKALGGTSGGTITWRAWEEGPQKYLSVTDNGPGATKEAFRALYDDTAPIGIKSGLGLHIVRDLAKAIGCQLLVNPGQGTGVELQLKFS
jgi:C4-dicarboxylate-specific signal transduction histidine kinase